AADRGRLGARFDRRFIPGSVAQRRASMFEFSEKSKSYQKRVGAFFHQHILPNDAKVAEAAHNGNNGDRWQPIQIIEDLKEKAKEAGLWNMFLPESQRGAGLSNFEYAPICEIFGRYPWSS